MRLSLIGMAGSGKSYWSRKLEGHGYRRFCCDDMIAEKLASELKNPEGTPMSVAEWMGFPYEAGYNERESRYLSLEAEVLREIIEYLGSREGDPEESVVVDTTGSVIYTGDELLKKLSRVTTIVLLETPSAGQERLLKAYLEHPHPMLWRGMFSRKPGESSRDSLARCYPDLFVSRARVYKAYADVTIGHENLWRKSFGIKECLGLIDAFIRNSPGQGP